MSANRADAIRWTGIGLILAGATVRSLTTLTELPGWDLDPSLIAAPLGGVGPAASMWIDVVLLIGAALTLCGDALLARRPVWWALALAAVGCIPIVYHGWLRGPHGGSLEQARTGAAWGAAIIAATALWLACRDEAPRRVAAAVLLGIAAVLALKGAHQLLVEHPRTLADYQSTREVFLAAQGWIPDSPMARAYERRLNQREATGWFGLANVYATFCAAAAVGLGVLAAGLLRSSRNLRLAAGLGAVALAAAAGLFMSGAKGGLIAAAAGAGAAVALAVLSLRPAARLPRRTAIASLIAAFAVAGPIALVILRGQLAEDAFGADRSLLFRWFYVQAAARITADHPLLGVGPAGFQDAYLTAKDPLSTEDVRSPHSLVLDWLATLGFFGLAWAGLFLAWVVHAAVRAVRAPRDDADMAPAPHSDSRTELRVAFLACAGATIAAAWFDRGHTTPDAALIRVAGLVAWCLVAWVILHGSGWPAAAPRDRRAGMDPLSLALAGAALTAAAHGQIDVAGSWPQSAALFLALVAASGGPVGARVPAPANRVSRLKFVPAALAAVLALMLAASGAMPAQRWERDLLAAADRARVLADANDILARTNSTDPTEASRARAQLLRLLSDNLQRRIEPAGPAVEAALSDLEIAASRAAADRLLVAVARDPADWRPAREASRMLTRAAAALARTGRREAADETFTLAVVSLGGPVHASDLASENRPATQLAWLAVIYRTRNETLGTSDGRLRDMANALEAAAVRDPTNPDHAAKLALALRDLHDPQAAAWARCALERDALTRLDPLARALAEEQRKTLRGLASEP